MVIGDMINNVADDQMPSYVDQKSLGDPLSGRDGG